MKKGLIFIGMVMLLVILTACGETSNSSGASTGSTSTPAAIATPEPTPSASAEASTPTESESLNPDGVFNVVLTDGGAEKLKVITVVRDATGNGLVDSKDLVDNVPSIIGKQLTLTEAEELKALLVAEGAVVELQETEKEEVVSTGVTLLLTDAGTGKLNVVKEIRTITGLGLAESKEIVDTAPAVILENITLEEAEAYKETLEAVGATIEIQQ